MAFVVDTSVVTDDKDVTKEFTFAPADVDVTFRSFNDSRFQKAYSLLNAKHAADMEKLLSTRLDDTIFDDIREGDKTADELLVKAIGNFLVVDWSVEDQNGDTLPPTGDNFVLLLVQLPQDKQMEFVTWCLDCAGKVSTLKAETKEVTKKKPSTATRGKKTSAT